ncbi:hypothetical protein EW146_g5359 [Bondarzewia mesenterica]|uniref:Uncharacterized protein n=1 Tax=Bondarzewia mesenterica TaxID=1095465 RepID=A0A4S4LRQ5_9AGAM|nr:hypothetical protein EW146_g5359 [Bondarzewia mesenterica]
MNPNALPPTFTSVYRLFLRASSASVLHHKTATRHLRLLWRPTFREAAKVIRKLQDDHINISERQRCEKWMSRWEQNIDNTLELLYNSSRSRGLPHQLTKNLSFLCFGYQKWQHDQLYGSTRKWDPSPEKHQKGSAPKPGQNIERGQFKAEAWGALEEVARMAEGTAGITLGRMKFVKRRS